jgi:hypothetical protein
MKDYLHNRSQQAFHDVYKFTNNYGYFVVIDFYEMATRYVNHLHYPNHSIAAYLKSKGMSLLDNEVEAA